MLLEFEFDFGFFDFAFFFSKQNIFCLFGRILLACMEKKEKKKEKKGKKFIMIRFCLLKWNPKKIKKKKKKIRYSFFIAIMHYFMHSCF